ncbi:DUF421 domain-containing protein [uncultured Psychrobacter sp.]|uniref:DUF421 domain-containing protein n=1 Tax=uncultured Psychrobacter sp. TaxID=259303 RepID=UPI0034578DED
MDLVSILIYDTTWSFVAEIILRTAIMFSMIIIFLRFTGKRGVRQLSIFELTIILSLGSIAGDPMFTEDLPIIQAIIIMSVVIGLYRLCTWFMMKYQPFENLLEGRAVYIVEDGLLVLDKIKKGKMSHDEFFAEMRTQGVEHLGQVRVGLLETDGNFSLLLFSPDDTRYGMPIFPKQYQAIEKVEPEQLYACMYCGHVTHLFDPNEICTRCDDDCENWAPAINTGIVR